MISPVSEDCLLITLASRVKEGLPAHIARICHAIEQLQESWLVDLVPSYTTILVVYDPLVADFRRVQRQIGRTLADIPAPADEKLPSRHSEQTLHTLPVYYSDETGPDLEQLARDSGLSTDEVISRHTAKCYDVYAIGFAPGFAFMGQVDEAIAHPRKKTPRKRVPAGSVAIANRQTAVYPLASPGGWLLIGRCPTKLFDPDTFSLLGIGDRVRFESVSRERFLELGGEL